jgi:RND family efflux transporter MFP subunit
VRDLKPADSRPGDPSKAAGAPVTALDPARWSRLRDAASPEELASGWLPLQAELIGDAVRGVVVAGPPEEGPFQPLARWPDSDPGSALLSSASEVAMAERRGVVKSTRGSEGSDEPGTEAMAYPILVDDELCGVAALELRKRAPADLRAAMRQLQWGLAWLEVLVRRRGFASPDRLVTVLELVAVALEHSRLHASATATATELATHFRCDRVAIGFRKGEHTEVAALSHSAGFGEKTNLIRAIGAAMDEAGDQQATLVYPPPEDAPPRVVRAHEELARQHGSAAVCTIPLANEGSLVGGLTLERSAGPLFESREVELVEHAGALLGPLLEIKRRDDRWVLAKLRDSARAQLEKLTGPRHAGLKLALPALALLLLVLTLAEGSYRVTADATLEGTVQRVVTAPIDGYIAEQHVRAGDLVSEGQLLAALDDRDLGLERMRWESERNRRLREYTQALAERNRAQVRILSAQLEQAEAQLELIEEQLARTRIVAPFDGAVVKGDLSQHLSAPVGRGDVLFEVAPLEGYRVVLEVDEREITQIAVGQAGHLALTGLAGETLPLTVEKMTPVATAEQGRNFFRVEARLEESPQVLRPGMQGVGKIQIGPRRLLWIYTHKLVHWWRMWVWSWWP